jgi:MYXO-CTERM domain-containing protein
MKKIIASLALVAVATFANAQGYIEYYGSASNIQTNTGVSTYYGGSANGTFGKTGGFVAGAGTPLYDYELLYETTTLTGNSSPTNSAWSPVLTGASTSLGYGTNSAAPGGLGGPGFSGGVQVNLASGTQYSVELVGWSASLGSYSSVLADIAAGSWAPGSFIGWTGVGTITPSASLGSDPTLFPQTFANATLTMFASPTPTPEPMTAALAGLGGLALLGLRRKK